MKLEKTLTTLNTLDTYLDMLGYNNEDIKKNITLSKLEIQEAINFTSSSIQLKNKQEIDFEKWIRDNNYEKITELNYKKGRKVININTLRRLYNIEYINL